jgi:seryl-tRNA synthetase
VTELTIDFRSSDITYGPDESFRRELMDNRVLVPTGVDGLYGKSATFETIVSGLTQLISIWGEELGAERLTFPPVIVRETFEQTNYIESFPDLMGSVHVFRGSDSDHAELLRRLAASEDWPAMLEPADVTLASAACHSVYPLCTGRLPSQGRLFDVLGYCFRHEPSTDPARMQSFRMQELVYVGDEAGAMDHRAKGLDVGLEMLRGLGLEMQAVPASDPFFGRAGRILANGQLDNELKIEGVTPICDAERPTAIMSGNYHQDHFSRPFLIKTADGGMAHSACVAFGIERITLALLHRHGLELGAWPVSVQRALGI